MPVKTVIPVISFVYLLLIAACNGSETCSKKVNCPGFDNKELTIWLPYKDNEQLVFASNRATYDTFHLKNSETSAPYETSTGSFGGSDQCSAYKTFQSIETDKETQNRLYIQLHTETPFFTTTASKNANINLDGNTIDLTDLKIDGFSEIRINNKSTRLQLLDNVTINNKTYPNVQVAMRDTISDKSPGIYEVYISKRNGIVAYRDSTLTWAKQ